MEETSSTTNILVYFLPRFGGTRSKPTVYSINSALWNHVHYPMANVEGDTHDFDMFLLKQLHLDDIIEVKVFPICSRNKTMLESIYKMRNYEISPENVHQPFIYK